MTDPVLRRLADVLDLQSGLFHRRQAVARGVTDNDLRRLVRRRELVRVHPGVYVTHTAPLTWLQRAWAGVLAVGPAALWLEAARRAADGPGRTTYDDGRPIDVAVSQERNVVPPAGVRLHRLAHLDRETLWNTSPPRQRLEFIVIDLAAAAERVVDQVALLADPVQARRTTADRLMDALATKARHPGRAFLRSVLADVAAGTCSTLEHGYLTLVERPHALPRGRRQGPVRASGRWMFRDVEYRDSRQGWSQIIELDGRLHHGSATARDRDLERDLDAALGNEHTARLGYAQVFDRGCQTAAKVGRLLNLRGWEGSALPCPRCTPRDLGQAG